MSHSISDSEFPGVSQFPADSDSPHSNKTFAGNKKLRKLVESTVGARRQRGGPGAEREMSGFASEINIGVPKSINTKLLLIEEILHQLISSLHPCLQGFMHPQVVQDFFHQQHLICLVTVCCLSSKHPS